MKNNSLLIKVAVITAVSLMSQFATRAQTVLLQDDFGDDSIDPLLWTTNTGTIPTPPFTPRTYEETGGAGVFSNRGYLITVNQFDPAIIGNLSVEGVWTAQSAGDVLTVATRSDGVPTGITSDLRQGIAFRVAVGASSSTISIESVDSGVSLPLASGVSSITAGETFAFQITDDGFSLTIAITRLGSGSPDAFLTAEVETSFASGHVSFFNGYGSFVATLDDVLISMPAQDQDQDTASDLIIKAIEQISSLSLPKGLTQSLTVKLDHALIDLALGSPVDGLEKVGAFIHQVRALAGKKISKTDASNLVDLAEQIRELLLVELGL